MPSGWHGSINEATDSWTDNTNVTVRNYSSAINWVMKGPMPGGNCNSDSGACSERSWYGDHLEVVDITFNEDVSFGTSLANCILDYPDVQETAAHEFGHAAGWLGHTTNIATSVMKVNAGGGCLRVPDFHDRITMNAQISGDH